MLAEAVFWEVDSYVGICSMFLPTGGFLRATVASCLVWRDPVLFSLLLWKFAAFTCHWALYRLKLIDWFKSLTWHLSNGSTEKSPWLTEPNKIWYFWFLFYLFLFSNNILVQSKKCRADQSHHFSHVSLVRKDFSECRVCFCVWHWWYQKGGGLFPALPTDRQVLPGSSCGHVCLL